MKEYNLYINGKWTESESGKTFERKNPANGEVLATFHKGTKKDALKAIDAAE